ncbi:MAG: helix-turn-helix transcriptional regulator [Terracidiphilus sp.]
MGKVKSNFGSILSEWRSIRSTSQLDLALATGVSQRHISFVESGRAQPSRELILKLSGGLDLPLRTRNELLLAAGFAPVYRERTLDLTEMKPARQALDHILKHHEPYPAIVTDAAWNIVMKNIAASRIIASCMKTDCRPQLAAGSPLNFMRLMFSMDGLRSHILNWNETSSVLMNRLRRETIANPKSPSAELFREIRKKAEAPGGKDFREDEPLDPVLPLELLVNGTHLRLFTMFTTFGTSQDIALQELRIDMSFPADEPTRHFLMNTAESGISKGSQDVVIE